MAIVLPERVAATLTHIADVFTQSISNFGHPAACHRGGRSRSHGRERSCNPCGRGAIVIGTRSREATRSSWRPGKESREDAHDFATRGAVFVCVDLRESGRG